MPRKPNGRQARPFAVHADQAEARFDNGVLVVKLPKARDTAPLRIQVQEQEFAVAGARRKLVADTFEYLSTRQFRRLSTAEKDRYLMALYEHLHGTHDRDAPKSQPETKTNAAAGLARSTAPRRRRSRDRATS